MDAGSLQVALEIVAIQMREIEREFEQLKAAREHLQAAHANLLALLKDNSILSTQIVRTAVPIEINAVPQPVELKPSWRIIQDVFPREGGTLTVPEIHKLVNANGTVIANPDAIRIAMRRHPEVFNNMGGRYSLKKRDRQEGVVESLNAEEATEVAS
jgi:hypothetical protein